jgi:hypothetical protein
LLQWRGWINPAPPVIKIFLWSLSIIYSFRNPFIYPPPLKAPGFLPGDNNRGGPSVALAKEGIKLRRIPLLLALDISFAESPEAPRQEAGGALQFTYS